MGVLRKHFKQWQAAVKLVRWGTIPPLIRLFLLDFGLFFVVITIITYVGGFLKNFKRRRRKFHFPHTDLDPVEIDGHTLRVFTYGGYAFRDMLRAIDAAEESIYLETYIFRNDEIGKEFKRRLINKAKAGVRVCIALDGFGGMFVPRAFRRYPKEVLIKVFSPLDSFLGLFIFGLYTRTHRKILVIDNKIAYLGGMNIGREYSSTWRDTHLRLDGSTAKEVSLAFAELWNRRNRHASRLIDVENLLLNPTHPAIEVAGSHPSVYLGSKLIRDHYLEAIKAAQSHILITNPYVLPDKELEGALLQALWRGVRLEIIVPQKTNQWVVNLLSRPIYKHILEEGGTIWYYQHTMNHSKTATIDGYWSTVGSANLDGRSQINHEINLFVKNAEFADCLEKMFADDLGNCRRVHLAEVARPSIFRHFAELFFYPVRGLV